MEGIEAIGERVRTNGVSFSLAMHARAHSVIHLFGGGVGNARTFLDRGAAFFVKLSLIRDTFDFLDFFDFCWTGASSFTGAMAFPFAYFVLLARIFAMSNVSPELIILERAVTLDVGGAIPANPFSR